MHIKNLIALLQINGIGDALGQVLLEKYPNIENIFSESVSALKALRLSDEIIAAIKNPDWQRVDTALNWAEQKNHYILDIFSENYPPLLKEIARPPLLLFVAGNLELLRTPQLAIVGSRNPTKTGQNLALDFAKDLSDFGLTITSGLALGIDSFAHEGALKSSGKTIAVLGHSIDKIYPAQNINLAKNIIENGGAFISSFPFGTSPKAENFPQRNRIISGLSLGTLVVEATVKSGSLITARLAAEQNREVFAIPGSIHNPLARGCNFIIKQGAKLVETVSDIIEELAPLIKTLYYVSQKESEKQNSKSVETTYTDVSNNQEYKNLLDCVGFEPTPIDVLVERSKLKIAEVSSMLLILELEGYIESVPGGYLKKIAP